MRNNYIVFGWDGYYPKPAPEAMIGGYETYADAQDGIKAWLEIPTYKGSFEHFIILDVEELNWIGKVDRAGCEGKD